MSQNHHLLKQRARQMRNAPTDAERILWYALRKRRLDGYPFLGQRVIDDMIVDFVCRKTKLVIEVDGGQHDQRRQADAARTRRLNRAGYRVLRFWNNEVILNTQAVLETIDQTLIEQDLQQANEPPQRRPKTHNQ
ncbi:MAG: endonuclease domain-containing protein [Chloroflexi bacterium]|nr:endonuclease domain-containing protein [Chloroflexota bacterium]MYK62064.1 endonuclease domain-containing protein [Chloroflexota bacterium]